MLQQVAAWLYVWVRAENRCGIKCVAVCCSVLQWDATRCRLLQRGGMSVYGLCRSCAYMLCIHAVHTWGSSLTPVIYSYVWVSHSTHMNELCRTCDNTLQDGDTYAWAGCMDHGGFCQGSAGEFPCVLQFVAVCCRLLRSTASCCILLHSAAFCCSLLQSVAVRCRLLHGLLPRARLRVFNISIYLSIYLFIYLSN